MSELHQGLARFACDVLPKGEVGGFDDLAMTAWQFGCMALVAMGVAEETLSGCRLLVSEDQLEKAIRPEGLWDEDAAVVLFALGEQRGYDFAEDATLLKIHAPEAYNWFVAHGWVIGDNWAATAANALIRYGIGEISCERLAEIATRTATEAPEDLRSLLISLQRGPTERDLAEYRAALKARQVKRDQDFRDEGFLPLSQFVVELSQEEKERAARVGWRSEIRHEMICAMESRWRPSLGWDSGEALLPLFHDQLVKAVVQHWEAA